jgi:hypothetical protein
MKLTTFARASVAAMTTATTAAINMVPSRTARIACLVPSCRKSLQALR